MNVNSIATRSNLLCRRVSMRRWSVVLLALLAFATGCSIGSNSLDKNPEEVSPPVATDNATAATVRAEARVDSSKPPVPQDPAVEPGYSVAPPIQRLPAPPQSPALQLWAIPDRPNATLPSANQTPENKGASDLLMVNWQMLENELSETSLPPPLAQRMTPPVANFLPDAFDVIDAESLAQPPVDGDAEQASVHLADAVPLQSRIVFPSPVEDESTLQFTRSNNLISLKARGASVGDLMKLIAEQSHLNLISNGFGDERIDVTLTDVPLHRALELILPLHGYAFTVQDNILIVSSMEASKSVDRMLQGVQMRVFPLNYVSGVEVLRVVEGVVSPLGKAYINETQSDNSRRTHELLIVEDTPSYLFRVEEFLRQIDLPPRQVQVEAHILQVVLRDDCRHGVDFDQLIRLSNSEVSLAATGFTANGGPATSFRIQGTDLTSLVDLLKSTTDAKTLASPKVTVLNGQQSKMQVGGSIGYLLTTTTQTAALQSVGFLEFGVILSVTPIITDSGQIILDVKPQVSSGRINQTTQLPESETTEVETRVMLNDGEALILGGLIKETDSETQNKVPILGDLWLVGRLFQRRAVVRERNEVIIALLPRIIPACGHPTEQEYIEVERAVGPLLGEPLKRIDRTHWEPQLPDAMTRPQRLSGGQP